MPLVWSDAVGNNDHQVAKKQGSGTEGQQGNGRIKLEAGQRCVASSVSGRLSKPRSLHEPRAMGNRQESPRGKVDGANDFCSVLFDVNRERTHGSEQLATGIPGAVYSADPAMEGVYWGAKEQPEMAFWRSNEQPETILETNVPKVQSWEG